VDEVLNSIEEGVIRNHGYSYEKYEEDFKRFKKFPEVSQINTDTKNFIDFAARGEIHNEKIDLPKELTPEIYILCFRRELAIRRQTVYNKVRKFNAEGQPLNNTEILAESEEEREKVAQRVCNYYRIFVNTENNKDRYVFTLRRAYYNYMCNKEFEEKIEKEKEIHNSLIAVILEKWIIPDLEKDICDLTDQQIMEKIDENFTHVMQYIEPNRNKDKPTPQ